MDVPVTLIVGLCRKLLLPGESGVGFSFSSCIEYPLLMFFEEKKASIPAFCFAFSGSFATIFCEALLKSILQAFFIFYCVVKGFCVLLLIFNSVPGHLGAHRLTRDGLLYMSLPNHH